MRQSLIRRPLATRQSAWLATQALVVLGAVLAYVTVRGLTEGMPEEAARNAHQILDIEQSLGIAWEQSVQAWAIGSDLVITLFNWIYLYGYWPVLAITMCWLAIRHRAVFLRARDAMLSSGAVGLLIFATLPVAPPRLLGTGFVDTLSQQSSTYQMFHPPGFTNQYAAMPSLHVGWSLLIGLALIAVSRRLPLRLLGVAMPVAMNLAVVATANHYLLDTVAGAVLSATAWIVAGQLRARGWLSWSRVRRDRGADSGARAPAVVIPQGRAPALGEETMSAGGREAAPPSHHPVA